MLAGPDAFAAGSSGRVLAGAGLVLLGTALFGAYTIVLRPLADSYGAVPAAAASTVAGAVPYGVRRDAAPGSAGRPALGGLGRARVPGLVSTVAGPAAVERGDRRTGPARAGLLLYLEPLVGRDGRGDTARRGAVARHRWPAAC